MNRRGIVSARLSVVLALLTSAVFLALGVMSFHKGTAKTRPVVVPFDLFWCEKDEDCVPTRRVGCCSCKQGGAQAAVTRWHVDDLRRFLKSACNPEQVCVQVDSCRNDLQARCVDHQCRLVHQSTAAASRTTPSTSPSSQP
jgi:hypothetical protein